ncbi:Mobile element protein [Methanosarcina barkeri str. Wiesmoor]|uniref:Mobile element protein n=1 Tax=Methanosarcina barkeri str. Wiesmoor TaxID=1434109 RepID=A0A0E3LLT7_METBA|nr:Mobile element protein [Methanosarcina barkeri str. Wiesmoor]
MIMSLIDYSKYKVQEANFKFWDDLYNWALEQKIKTYEQYNKSISRFDLQRILVYEVKPANKWLKETNSQTLLACLVNVEFLITKIVLKF